MSGQQKNSLSILSLELNGKTLGASALTAVLICVSFSVQARSWSHPAAKLNPMALSTAQVAPTPEELEQVTLTLTANGFNPSELTRAAGGFLLSVDNRSGVAELIFQITRQDGIKIREIKVSKGNIDWSEEINLSASQYTLTEANHSTWVCHIIAQ